MDPVLMTSNISLVPTTTVDDCPPLDYLLIGGPDPMTFKLDEKFADFIRKHVAAAKRLFGFDVIFSEHKNKFREPFTILVWFVAQARTLAS